MRNAVRQNPMERRKRSSTLDAEVGMRIRSHRKQAKMTLQMLANSLGIAYQQVQKYETGVNRIGAGRLMEIAEILGIPVASFFSDPDRSAYEKRSLAETAVTSDAKCEAALQGRQLLVAFLRIKDLNRRKLALAYVRSLVEPEKS